MCGIAGGIGPRNQAPSPDRIAACLEIMRERGPDAKAAQAFELGGQTVTLLHRRLAIIDLDPRSNQPFTRNAVTVCFNGEIYNYLEVRRDLERLGHQFRTNSDTEVLAAAWEQWGEAALGQFEGMWALAVVDGRTGSLTLSRDRFGEKPLYVWAVEDTIYFASDIPGLMTLAGAKPSVNERQILRYLVHGYKALHKHGDTFLNGVLELPPGTSMTLRDGHLAPPEFYWRLDFKPRPLSRKEALDGVRARLARSMELRLRADVPLAFCLSGGVDSTTLAAIAKKTHGAQLHCFSIVDSDERYDETRNLGVMVRDLGCEHTVVKTSRDGFFDRMAALCGYRMRPVATISYYLHAFLSESIAANGFKVAISGTAADEIFTGYYDHHNFWLAQMWRRAQIDPGVDFETLLADWRRGAGGHVANPVLRDPMAFVKNPGNRDHILLNSDVFNTVTREPLNEAFEDARFTDDLLRNRLMNELFFETVPVLLEEDDANSMRASIENRSPFLDRDLVEFMFTVPGEHLMQGGRAKALLRAAGEGLVPDEVRLDSRKRGFNASITSLVDHRNNETRERLLSDNPIFDVVDRSRLEALLDDDMKTNSLSKFLFSFISARTFMERHEAFEPGGV